MVIRCSQRCGRPTFFEGYVLLVGGYRYRVEARWLMQKEPEHDQWLRTAERIYDR